MGRGNFYAGDPGDQWYIDYDLYDWDDPLTASELLQEDINQVLMAIRERFPSFHSCHKCLVRRDMDIELENKFFWIGTAENQWSIALWIVMRDDEWEPDENLAMRHYWTYHDEIERMLLDQFGTICKRCGPWTSRTITKDTQEKEMA